MKRYTVAVTKEIDEALSELKRTGRYRHCSYSELIRQMVGHGLEVVNAAGPGRI